MKKLAATPAQMAKSIAELEDQVKSLRDFLAQGLLPSINNAIEQRVAQAERSLPALEALVTLTGRDVVAAEMVRLEKERIDRNIASAKETIARNLERGLLVTSETIDEQCLVVGTEADKGGNVTEAWASLAFEQIRPELKPDFIGRKVGDEVTFGDGGKFKVLEIYRHGVTAAAAPTA